MMLVLCGLIACGWGFYQHHNPPQKKAPMESAAGVAAAAELREAGDQLYLTKRWADTFDGPDLKNFRDLTLVRANDTSFCLEGREGGLRVPAGRPGRRPRAGHLSVDRAEELEDVLLRGWTRIRQRPGTLRRRRCQRRQIFLRDTQRSE